MCEKRASSRVKSHFLVKILFFFPSFPAPLRQIVRNKRRRRRRNDRQHNNNPMYTELIPTVVDDDEEYCAVLPRYPTTTPR